LIDQPRRARGRPVKVSIGLPVYNGESFLHATLESLLAQTFDDFELIISDNASTDRTGEIAQRFVTRDVRVRYHRNSSNLGLAANFNGLIRMADGDLFKWATADDVCRPMFLECCVAALEKSPDAVLAYPRTQFIDQADHALDIEDPGFPLHWPRAVDRWCFVVAAEHWVNAILGVIRRSALLRTRFLPSYPGGDYVLLGELCLLGRFIEVPDVLFLRRIHPEASSQMKGDEGRFFKLMTGKSERIMLPAWQRMGAHLRTAVRSELRLLDKGSLVGAVAWHAFRRRERLLGEASRGLGRMRSS
jgi:glycosyltransferase involved in cell wall biosynthesis